MTAFRPRRRLTVLAAACIVAIGVLLVAGIKEAQAAGGGYSQSYSWSAGSSWGAGPNGFYSNGYANSSWKQSSYGYGPFGGFNQSQGAYQSNSWGSGFNPGSGVWGYNNASGGGYNNSNWWH